ncbi:tyrosyl-DNA phosphodiesterase 1 [Branchiostoma belcheri]|nr:tyrosyl-DNA phosphodiesterase 1 [Branchiostoma belcheri]
MSWSLSDSDSDESTSLTLPGERKDEERGDCAGESSRTGQGEDSSGGQAGPSGSGETGRHEGKQKRNTEKDQRPACKFGRQCYRKNPVHLREYRHPVSGIAARFNQTGALHIADILAAEKGELVASAQFNYMIDIPWLMQQYPQEARGKPLLIVHGDSGLSKVKLQEDAHHFSNIQLCQVGLTCMTFYISEGR